MPKTGISNSPAEAHKPWGPASAAVGKALDYLLELRLENGPLGEERATEELLNWWSKENPTAK